MMLSKLRHPFTRTILFNTLNGFFFSNTNRNEIGHNTFPYEEYNQYINQFKNPILSSDILDANPKSINTISEVVEYYISNFDEIPLQNLYLLLHFFEESIFYESFSTHFLEKIMEGLSNKQISMYNFLCNYGHSQKTISLGLIDYIVTNIKEIFSDLGWGIRIMHLAAILDLRLNDEASLFFDNLWKKIKSNPKLSEQEAQILWEVIIYYENVMFYLFTNKQQQLKSIKQKCLDIIPYQKNNINSAYESVSKSLQNLNIKFIQNYQIGTLYSDFLITHISQTLLNQILSIRNSSKNFGNRNSFHKIAIQNILNQDYNQDQFPVETGICLQIHDPHHYYPDQKTLIDRIRFKKALLNSQNYISLTIYKKSSQDNLTSSLAFLLANTFSKNFSYDVNAKKFKRINLGSPFSNFEFKKK